MKITLHFTALLLWVGLNGQSPHNDRITVYFFLLEDCKISQAYIPTIRQLHTQFAGDSIVFAGLFPNPISSASSVTAFQQKYDLPFSCNAEGTRAVASRFGIEVTPEVVVFQHAEQKILYRGRIDNLFERVGKRRKIVTSHDLRDALKAIQQNLDPPRRETQAVGCILPPE